MRPCRACGQEFERGYCRGYCSNACYSWAQRLPGVPRPLPGSPMQCPACGTIFARNGRKRFCSKFCLDVFNGHRFIGPQGVVITCVLCGKREAAKIAHKKTCRACWAKRENLKSNQWRERNPERYRERDRKRDRSNRLEYYRERTARRRQERIDAGWVPPEKRPPKPLPFRLWVIQVRGRPKPKPRRFIAGFCAWCGGAFVTEARSTLLIRRFCSEPCSKRWWRRERRGEVGPNKRLMVFVAAGWVCHLCGERTDSREFVPHPLAATVDHITPRSLGGSDDIANLACAHFSCNSARGAMSLEEWHGRARANA